MKALAALLIAAAWTLPANAQDSNRASPLDARDSTRPSTLSARDSTRLPAEPTIVAKTHPYRSPRRALILGSIIPGAGHIYAGEYWHGVVNYETTVAGIGGGLLMFMIDACTFNFMDSSCDPGPQWPHRVLGVTMVGLGFWRWISSARDAPLAAERANEKHRRITAKATPIIEAPVGSGRDWRAGVAIQW
jgi:hypothetical protein